jgi:hypothetical protein
MNSAAGRERRRWGRSNAGIRGYRITLSFFLGLIVGEAVVGIGWAVFRVFRNVPIYNFFGS